MTVIVTTSLVKQFKETMQALIKKNVYVGIPEDHNKREEGQVTNSQLGYINEFGSPARNIPARPFLIPGVKEAGDKVSAILSKAAITTESGPQDVDIALNKAGQVARDTVKRRIQQSTDIEPLSPVTMKIRSTRKKNRRTGVMKPLIDTGQMLNSITYVVRED
jgi:hypothetical protein